jgi:hypothetical protein
MPPKKKKNFTKIDDFGIDEGAHEPKDDLNDPILNDIKNVFKNYVKEFTEDTWIDVMGTKKNIDLLIGGNQADNVDLIIDVYRQLDAFFMVQIVLNKVTKTTREKVDEAFETIASLVIEEAVQIGKKNIYFRNVFEFIVDNFFEQFSKGDEVFGVYEGYFEDLFYLYWTPSSQKEWPKKTAFPLVNAPKGRKVSSKEGKTEVPEEVDNDDESEDVIIDDDEPVPFETPPPTPPSSAGDDPTEAEWIQLLGKEYLWRKDQLYNNLNIWHDVPNVSKREFYYLITGNPKLRKALTMDIQTPDQVISFLKVLKSVQPMIYFNVVNYALHQKSWISEDKAKNTMALFASFMFRDIRTFFTKHQKLTDKLFFKIKKEIDDKFKLIGRDEPSEKLRRGIVNDHVEALISTLATFLSTEDIRKKRPLESEETPKRRRVVGSAPPRPTEESEPEPEPKKKQKKKKAPKKKKATKKKPAEKKVQEESEKEPEEEVEVDDEDDIMEQMDDITEQLDAMDQEVLGRPPSKSKSKKPRAKGKKSSKKSKKDIEDQLNELEEEVQQDAEEQAKKPKPAPKEKKQRGGKKQKVERETKDLFGDKVRENRTHPKRKTKAQEPSDINKTNESWAVIFDEFIFDDADLIPSKIDELVARARNENQKKSLMQASVFTIGDRILGRLVNVKREYLLRADGQEPRQADVSSIGPWSIIEVVASFPQKITKSDSYFKFKENKRWQDISKVLHNYESGGKPCRYTTSGLRPKGCFNSQDYVGNKIEKDGSIMFDRAIAEDEREFLNTGCTVSAGGKSATVSRGCLLDTGATRNELHPKLADALNLYDARNLTEGPRIITGGGVYDTYITDVRVEFKLKDIITTEEIRSFYGDETISKKLSVVFPKDKNLDTQTPILIGRPGLRAFGIRMWVTDE